MAMSHITFPNVKQILKTRKNEKEKNRESEREKDFNIPTRANCERDIIHMIVWISFNKFDACEILPMFHCLFEQRFMCTTEICINFIWNNAIVPDSFFFCCCCSCNTMMMLL